MRTRFALITALAALALWLAPPAASAAKPTMAVFTLRPMNFEAIGYDGEILYALITALEQEHKVALMPRREMEERLFQEGLAQSDTPEGCLSAGKKLGLDYIVFGQVTRSDGVVRAKVNLLNVRARQVVGQWTREFTDSTSIQAGARELAAAIGRLAEGGASSAAPAGAEAPGPAPSAVNNVAAANHEGAVRVTWSFAADAPVTRFNVYRSGDASGPFRFLGATDKNAFVDETAAKGASYHYQVGAIMDNGREVRSPGTAKIASVGEAMPHPPLILDATGHVGRVHLTFVPSLQNVREDFDIEHHLLYRRHDSESDWTRVKELPAKSSSNLSLEIAAADDALADGQTYHYAISSVDGQGRESALSDPVAVATVPIPELTATGHGLLRRAGFSWPGSENVRGYYLYRQEANGSWEKIATIRQGETTYVDRSGLADGQSYRYRMTAYDRQGESRPSDEVRVTTKPLPDPPAGLEAASGLVKSVRISWTPLADPDVGGYAIYRGQDQDNLSQVDRVAGHENGAYLDQGTVFEKLGDATTYYYAVAAYNTYKAEGEPSTFVTATTKPRPGPVAGFTAARASDSAVKLTWQPSPAPDIASYRIEREVFSGMWSEIAATSGADTAYIDDDVAPGNTYNYRITAVDEDGLASEPRPAGPVEMPE